MEAQDIEASWAAADRVIVAVDDNPDAQRVIRRAWRLASRFQTDLIAVFVETPGWAGTGPEERGRLEQDLRFAEDLGAEIVRVQDSDPAKALLRVARSKNAGSIVIGAPRRRLPDLLGRSTASKLLRAGQIDVYAITGSDEN